MSRISYVKYTAKKGRLSNAYYKAVSDGLNEFIKHNGWYENLPERESRNYGVDLECSYLCHAIWFKVMKNKSNEGKYYSSNYFFWSNDESNEKILFHFDIMNNPKKSSCGLASCSDENEIKKWKQIYHSIGNMAPIPWFEVTGKHFINCQTLHKSLDERWDLFLNTLEKNWSVWNSKKSFTFKSYMLLTCQHIYYKDVYNDYKSNIKNINNIDLKKLENWEKYITDNEDLDIISFSDYKEEAVAHLITDIIKIRCRIISLIFNEQ